MIIILADNIIPPEKMDDSFQMDILNGKYDDGLEWLVHKSISAYMDSKGKPFISEDHKQSMVAEHNFKSDPLKTAIEFIFVESDFDNLEVKLVTREIKNWFKWAVKTGKIFDEHNRPSASQITKAMNRAGYFKGRSTVYDEEHDTPHQVWVYEDIKLNEDWREIYKTYKNEKAESLI